MSNVLWLTDIHLNFLPDNQLNGFIQELKDLAPDSLIVTGDITEAPHLKKHLTALAEVAPVYFVLGNHDYYRSSFGEVQTDMKEFSIENINIQWLSNPDCFAFPLSNRVGLVGVDGWYDGKCGFTNPPKLEMSDWHYIQNLRPFNPFRPYTGSSQRLLEELDKIAQKQAHIAENKLKDALTFYDHVVFATHVPPWEPAAWYQGKMSEAVWRPWMTNVTLGKRLESVMRRFGAGKKLTVLCGHTHNAGVYHAAENIVCYTGSPGKADYGDPEPFAWIRANWDEVKVETLDKTELPCGQR